MVGESAGGATRVQTLGVASVDGEPVKSRRALELVAVLALSGGEAPRDWIIENLFENQPSPSSLPTLAMRARNLGIRVSYNVNHCRYLLESQVSCDVVDVLAHLQKECLTDALAIYHGPFIPRSQSPFAMEIRGELETQMSAAAIRSGDPGLMTAVDRLVKHPELSASLIRARADLSTISLSRSWLKTLVNDL